MHFCYVPLLLFIIFTEHCFPASAASDTKNETTTVEAQLPGVKTEIPRIRTLRLANRYIAHLGRILRGEHVFCEQSQAWHFERTVGEEMQTSNSYKERAELELLSSCSASSTTTIAEAPTAMSAQRHILPPILQWRQ
ncbi:hypothetical protein GPALN_011523 [Globodera pallida]|nr:hypothetical protein GPALN_011523 [Globodera pallida]